MLSHCIICPHYNWYVDCTDGTRRFNSAFYTESLKLNLPDPT